ncbi:MAG: hypothetical protein WCA21_02890 [Terracidiphilus sp.]
MEITTRSLWTLIHGMGFGALYLLAGSGAVIELQSRFRPDSVNSARAHSPFLGRYLASMAALAWLTVLTGTYLIYPWYRTPPPAGTSNLAAYPRAFLLAHPSTSAWHSIGMEWKEHVAWLVPIAITMAAVVAIRHRNQLTRSVSLRYTLQSFVVLSLVAAGIAGFFGAMLDKAAPIDGGTPIQIVKENTK